MATLAPFRRSGSRAHMPLVPPFKYDAKTYLTVFNGPVKADLDIFLARFLIDVTAGPLFGPISIPTIPNGKAIIAAYAHPFIWGDVNTAVVNPTALDAGVIRPQFAIRGEKVVELHIAHVNLTTAAALTGNTGVEPLIEALAQERMVADFHVDATLAGLNNQDNAYPVTIVHVKNDGADPNAPLTHTIYQIQLNQGSRKRISVSNLVAAPQVGDPYPSTWVTSRYGFLVGQDQQEQDHMYPKRNMREVPNLSPNPDHNQVISDNANPFAIAAIRTVLDLPNNPATYVKRVTLNDGSTVTVPLATSTVVGEEIGHSTGTGSLQTSIDVQDFASFDAILVTAPSKGDGTLGGIAVDPWPLR